MSLFEENKLTIPIQTLWNNLELDENLYNNVINLCLRSISPQVKEKHSPALNPQCKLIKDIS